MAEPNALASVIIPTYNRAHFLAECVRSVFAQTYRPIEVIVVDDGSTDDILSVLEALAEEARTQAGVTFRHQKLENGGACRARNRGFAMSAGRYIAFLDSDDLFMPEKLEAQIEMIERGGYDMVYARNQRLATDGSRIKQLSGRALTHDSRDLCAFSWQTMAATYSRTYLELIGPWNEALPNNQDWEFCNRAVLAGGKIGFMDCALQLYRYHDAGRIGDPFPSEHIRGRQLATRSVFEKIVGAGRLDRLLERQYRKHFLSCACHYAFIRRIKDADKILEYTAEQHLITSFQRRLMSLFIRTPFLTVPMKVNLKLVPLKKTLRRNFLRK